MMSKEFESKFLNIDVDNIRTKLKQIGATLDHKKTAYFRTVFHRCTDNVKGYARVRQEARGKVTSTVKIYNDPKFPEEYEITVNGTYDDTTKFISSLGLQKKAVQETYRERWTHPRAHELCIDWIPGIPAYLEIDCTTEEDMNHLITVLEMDLSQQRFGAFDAQYEEYYGIQKDIINNNTPSLTFANIMNEIKPIKNHELLAELAKEYAEPSFKIGNRQRQRRTKKTYKRSHKSRRQRKLKA